MSTELLRESTVPSAMPMTMVRKAHPEEAHRRLAEAATTNAQTASRTKLGSIRRRLIPPLSQELTESHGVRGGPQRQIGRASCRERGQNQWLVSACAASNSVRSRRL